VEDLESGDVEYSDEVISVESLLIESHVALLDQPVEDTGVESLCHRTHRPVDLLHVLALVHPLGSDLHTRLQQSLEEFLGLDSVHRCSTLSVVGSISLSLFFSRSLLELHV
ncbi:hypothetical protein PMAYCL1PPCAC_02204, partial [Pristionchus mayeri]